MSISRSALITVMVRAAEKAARGLVRDFGEVEHLQVSKKGPADFVSAADIRAEKILREELGKARPDYGFLMEESGASNTEATQRWIVDPLDGTTNFLHGVPHWAISIAAEQQGEIVGAVIYQPVNDQLFWAERGQGAYLNNQRLRVSARRDLSECLIATGIPFGGHEKPGFLSQLERVMTKVSGVRRMGAASLDLAYVAAGRFDAYWETGIGGAWDVAAGILLVRESGGFISTLSGKGNPVYSGDIFAANGLIESQLKPIILAA